MKRSLVKVLAAAGLIAGCGSSGTSTQDGGLGTGGTTGGTVDAPTDVSTMDVLTDAPSDVLRDVLRTDKLTAFPTERHRSPTVRKRQRNGRERTAPDDHAAPAADDEREQDPQVRRRRSHVQRPAH